MSKKQILLNAFNMNCVGHINHGLWTHPRDRSVDYRSLRYWTDLARTLERGLFDGLFIADILGFYDVYGASVDVTLREAVQLPVNDPLPLVSAMAAVTENLGFGLTVNANAEHPYVFARRMSTLDHLTDGRIGWNIVTGYLDSAARALGKTEQTEHDLRYEQAEDALSLLYKLWESSWEDDAVVADRARRIYADPQKVHLIHHEGPFYSSHGYHLSEPSPQRTPVLFQAGASARGSLFAARHAECIFISAPDPASALRTSRRLRSAAEAAGRRPDDIRIFAGVTVVAAQTDAQAEEKVQDYRAYASREAGLVHFSAGAGIDLAAIGLDEPVARDPGNAIQSNVQAARERGLTKRDIVDSLSIGGRYPVLAGSPAHVADAMERWIDEGEIDGFNLARTVVPESFTDFVDLVVPELQARGRYKTAYAPGTLRRKLFGAGDRLAAPHPGWRGGR